MNQSGLNTAAYPVNSQDIPSVARCIVSAPVLKVYMLGEFQIRCGEMLLTGSLMPRLRSLIAYLLLHRSSVPSRQQLAFLFWPDSTEKQARTNLRKAIYRLRQEFPALETFLELEGARLSWRADAAVWLDVAEFETRLQAAETARARQQPELLEAALALYKGDLLPDLHDDWVLPLRERLRQHYLDGLDRLAELQEAGRDYAAAVRTTRRLLLEDAMRERSYRRLMRLQALGGDVAGALHTYHKCAALLAQELGVEPSSATQAAYRQLLQHQARPPQALDSRAPRHLPLIGRDRSWQALLHAWRSAAGAPQAVFISGEAGIGKTRLAEELVVWAGRQGISCLKAVCYAAGEQLPLAPVADWLRSEPVQRALRALAPRWRSEVARVLPELLATDPELEMPRPMTEAWQQQHLFRAVAEAVLAAGEPLLLFLDDLHWADANTLAWLHFLMRQKHDAGILFLATHRSDEIVPGHPLPAWQHELARTVPVRHIALSRLDASATATLASHLLREDLDTAAAHALYQVTEGNPLFTVEMARAGLNRSKPALPDKIRSVIEFHLGRLTPPARELLDLAALIGRSFTFPLLAAASPLPNREVVRRLDEL
jgi:DNA-binding SARP family transcriptional activator